MIKNKTNVDHEQVLEDIIKIQKQGIKKLKERYATKQKEK